MKCSHCPPIIFEVACCMTFHLRTLIRKINRASIFFFLFLSFFVFPRVVLWLWDSHWLCFQRLGYKLKCCISIRQHSVFANFGTSGTVLLQPTCSPTQSSRNNSEWFLLGKPLSYFGRRQDIECKELGISTGKSYGIPPKRYKLWSSTNLQRIRFQRVIFEIPFIWCEQLPPFWKLLQ